MWSLIDEIGLVGLVLAIVAMFGGAAAQASIGMGLNLFTVGILALINPIFVPAPILVGPGDPSSAEALGPTSIQ